MDRDIALVTLSMDGPQGSAQMATLVGASFPVLADPDGRTVRAYGVYNLLDDGIAAPSTFIIGKDGAVLWSYVGSNAGDRPQALTILRQVDALVS